MISIETSQPILSGTNVSPVQKDSEQIASGQRVNHAQDDVVALAMINKLDTQIGGQEQAARNINDGISMSEIADQTLRQSSEMVQRMRELALQSANETLSNNQRVVLQEEFSQLQSEIQTSHQNATFNNQNLFSPEGAIAIQEGPESNDTISLPRSDINSQIDQADFFNANIATPQGATNALNIVDDSIQLITSARSNLGATTNRLEIRANLSQQSQVQTIEARGRISDADMAIVMANQTREMILDNSKMAIQGQANVATISALQMLGLE